MKKSFLIVLIGMFIVAGLWAENFKKDAKTIQSIMDRQVKAWNEGNIDGFMAGYRKSDEFTFQGGKKRVKGWEALRAMYKKNYAGEKMGELEFTDIEMKPLGKGYVLVTAQWRVTTKEEVKEGLFTLIFQRFGKDWKIIHDHSS
jgi:ketosteroid isomerase-like protein